MPALAVCSARERQHMAGDALEPLRVQAHEPRALERIIEPRVQWIDIDRQASLAPEVVEHVLVGRKDVPCIQAQSLGDPHEEGVGTLRGHVIIAPLIGDQRALAPDRLAVAAPEAI